MSGQSISNDKGSSSSVLKSFFINLLVGSLVSLIGLIVAIAAGEVVVRFVEWRSSQVKKWEDRSKEYFKPELAKTMQDFFYSEKKEEGVYRIAAIGDSFTFAPYMQFDDTFPKRMERWLNLNAVQPKIEVINYGVPRYSTSHEIPVVERAIKEDSDLILMQITLNDPEIKTDWPTELIPDRTGKLNVSGGIYNYWHGLRFVTERVRTYRSRSEYRDYFYNLFDNPKAWGQFEQSWKKIVEIAKISNKPIVAVIFPLFGITVGESYPFYPIHERVGKFLSSLQVPYVDITNEYLVIPIERLQVLPGYDRHPNEIGHRIAAEAILRWLRTQSLLPPEAFPKHIEKQRIGINPKEVVQ